MFRQSGFHNLCNHYLCFFSKHNEYCKAEAYIWVNFSRFLKRCSLDDFHTYKMSMGFYNGEKRVGQL